jgi:hypothetical protein
MSGPTYPIQYNAPPGVTLRKAHQPQDASQPTSGVARSESEPPTASFVRAPAGPGYQPNAARRGGG